MCGRFTYKMTWKQLHDLLEEFAIAVEELGEGVTEHPARYNIAPTQPIIVLFEDRGRRTARLMRWGLVPHWVKDPRAFSLIINARVETILQKPSFRGGLQHHRCLIPASGYYEWLTLPDGTKQPFYFAPKDGKPLLFGGLYSTWLGPTGEEIDTGAIITVKANADTAKVHERMPALIPHDMLDDWLSIDRIGPKQALRILAPAPEGALDIVPVSKKVNSNRTDGPNLIEPLRQNESKKPEAAKKAGRQGELF
jgi:putative SOS response-associated peptidase YedK